MCKAFSALVLKSGEVKWELGIDSHTRLAEKFGLREHGVSKDREDISYARVEYSPANEDYLHPDKWLFALDEDITPYWWTPLDEKAVVKAWQQWKRELDKVLIVKDVVNPFQRKPPKITDEHLQILRTWASVWDSVWDSVWESAGDSAGDSVWDSAWDSVLSSVGASVVSLVVASVRDSVWESVWESVGVSVRDSAWDSVWAYTGSFFKLRRDQWHNTEAIKTPGYPFQPAVDLWEVGLVPSYDSGKKTWRLHGGPEATILWGGELGRE